MSVHIDETRWMVAIWRDGDPPRVELRSFTEPDLVLAAQHASEAGARWTETYLLLVLAGPTPAGHRTIEQLAYGTVPWPLDAKALEVELRREIAELQTKLRDAELALERVESRQNTPTSSDPVLVDVGFLGLDTFRDAVLLLPDVRRCDVRFQGRDVQVTVDGGEDQAIAEVLAAWCPIGWTFCGSVAVQVLDNVIRFDRIHDEEAS